MYSNLFTSKLFPLSSSCHPAGQVECSRFIRTFPSRPARCVWKAGSQRAVRGQLSIICCLLKVQRVDSWWFRLFPTQKLSTHLQTAFDWSWNCTLVSTRRLLCFEPQSNDKAQGPFSLQMTWVRGWKRGHHFMGCMSSSFLFSLD